MKLLSTIILFLLSTYSFSQKVTEKVSTIYVSDNQNVLIFFDDPIIQGICGHTNFQFAFNIKEQSKYGIIRGLKGEKSNLHIITLNGNIYSFVLEYKEKISNFNYFIKSNNSVGNVNGEVVNNKITEDLKIIDTITDSNKPNKSDDDVKSDFKSQIKDESELLYNKDRAEFYRKFCSNMESKKEYFKAYYSENSKVVLYLEDIDINRDEIYFKLKIVNNSGFDYDVNFLNFSKRARKKRKQSSSQSVNLENVFSFNDFSKIPAMESRRAIYVFKKFGVNKDKIINIELNEAKGERNINLEIVSKTINNNYN